MAELDKWAVREQRAKNIKVGASSIEGAGWDEIKQWQSEWQKRFCRYCVHYDITANDFREKGHKNEPENCKLHWTDIIGACWNYKNREEAEKEGQYMEAELGVPNESPVIHLPTDEKRINQLKKKLAEYEQRLLQNQYKAPEQLMDSICKRAVLSTLLKDGKIVTWELSWKLAETYGESFSVREFQNACKVIEDYSNTGGKNVSGGTGLPE